MQYTTQHLFAACVVVACTTIAAIKGFELLGYWAMMLFVVLVFSASFLSCKLYFGASKYSKRKRYLLVILIAALLLPVFAPNSCWPGLRSRKRQLEVERRAGELEKRFLQSRLANNVRPFAQFHSFGNSRYWDWIVDDAIVVRGDVKSDDDYALVNQIASKETTIKLINEVTVNGVLPTK